MASVPRSDFLGRMVGVASALDAPVAQDASLVDAVHNDRARILRSGLTVVAFAALEDFLRRRAYEALSEVAASGVRFADLPADLQSLATEGVAKAFPFVLTVAANAGLDPIKNVQSTAAAIASTSGHPFTFSDWVFGYSRSNVADRDITDFLAAVHVTGGWSSMTRLANRLGLVGLDLAQSFRAFARDRHVSAHSPRSSVPANTLTEHLRVSAAIALSFDLLLSRSLLDIKVLAGRPSRRPPKVDDSQVRLRLVIEAPNGTWRERREGAKRATRVHPTRAVAESVAAAAALRNREFMVVLDSTRRPLQWATP
jgi:hypothetical protein